MLTSLCLSLSFLIYNVIGHSFMECSDYRGVISGQDYDFDLCYGFPRYWIEAERYWPDFGDTGGKSYGLSSLSGVDLCKDPIQSLDEDYDDTRPYATYTVGSTIRLVWPAKNHANYECKSYTADNTMQIWVLPEVNPTTDSTDLGEWELVIDWHAEAEADGYVFENGVGIDGIPFQNCPDFCDETDNAPCFGDWEFTEELYSRMGGQEGYYTFLWLWEFGEGAYYTTCWEAMVDANGVVVTAPTDTSDDDTDSDTTNTDTNTNTNTNTETNTNNGDTDTETDNTDDTTDNNSNNNNNDDDESEEEVEKVYQFTIPVCYLIDNTDNNALDNTKLMNAFDNLAAKDTFNGEVEFSLLESHQNNAGTLWNASIESNYMHNDFYVLMFRFIDNGTLCNLIMDEFGNSGSCSICGGASAHSEEAINTDTDTTNDDNSNTNNNNNNDNDNESESNVDEDEDELDTDMLILIIIILILVLLIIIAAYFFCKIRSKTKNGPNNNSMAGSKGAENIMATHITSSNAGMGNTQSNIVAVDDGAHATGTAAVAHAPPRPGGRPPRPPPPRPVRA